MPGQGKMEQSPEDRFRQFDGPIRAPSDWERPVHNPWKVGAIALIGAAAIAGFALIAWPWKAKAQQMPCAPYGQMSADLATKYGERVVGAGLDTPQSMVQLFVSPSGSWTIVSVDTNGLTCIRAAGNSWESIDLPEDGEES